jgi:hypothetical protein
LLCVGFPIAVAFIVGSPGRLGFWVALVGVFMITRKSRNSMTF